MITLIQAFRLCEIREEMIYLTTSQSTRQPTHTISVWSEKVRQKVDMKRIKVHRVRERFSFGEFLGMEFVVSGITDEELKSLNW